MVFTPFIPIRMRRQSARENSALRNSLLIFGKYIGLERFFVISWETTQIKGRFPQLIMGRKEEVMEVLYKRLVLSPELVLVCSANNACNVAILA